MYPLSRQLPRPAVQQGQEHLTRNSSEALLSPTSLLQCGQGVHDHLQDGKKAAVPKLDELLAPDSDSEEEPDVELQLPANKVKYMVGQGGDKIKYIQRKTKCRIQVRALSERSICAYACTIDVMVGM